MKKKTLQKQITRKQSKHHQSYYQAVFDGGNTSDKRIVQ